MGRRSEMASGTKFADEYKQAERAYMLGSYEEAAVIIDRLSENYPTDPTVCLLKGHIYCYGLQRFDVAKEQYQSVLNLTTDAEYINYANKGLADAEEFSHEGLAEAVDGSEAFEFADQDLEQNQFDEELGANRFAQNQFDQNFDNDQFDDSQFTDIDADFVSTTDSQVSPFAEPQVRPEWQNTVSPGEELSNDFDFADLSLDSTEDLRDLGLDSGNPFAMPQTLADSATNESNSSVDNPFASTAADPLDDLEDFNQTFPEQSAYAEPFGTAEDRFGAPTQSTDSFSLDDLDQLDQFDPVDPVDESFNSSRAYNDQSTGQSTPRNFNRSSDDETLFMGLDDQEPSQSFGADASTGYAANFYDDDDDHTFVANSASYNPDLIDEQDFSTSEEPSLEDSPVGGRSNVDFLDEFDEFDDLGSLPDFDLSDNSVDFTSPSIGSSISSTSGSAISTTSSFDFSDADQSVIRDDDAFPLASSGEPLPTFTQSDSRARCHR
jgi:twitching motility protein PilJ